MNNTKINKSKILLLTDMNIKTIFMNKSLWMEIVFFYILSMVLPIIFIPFFVSGAMFTIIGICIPILIVLGNTGYKFKQSTIYDNVSLVEMSENKFYLSQLITCFIFGNILSLGLWTGVYVVGLFPLFLGGWIWEGALQISINPFAYGAWINIIYITQVTILLSFAFYFLISNITKDGRAYYMSIMIILILCIVFGGSINTYFSSPYQYTFWDVYDTPMQHGSYVFVDKEHNVVYINDIAQQSLINHGPTQLNKTGIQPRGNLFPTTVFIPTLLNPFYGIGEFSSCAITKQVSQDMLYLTNADIYIVDGPNFLEQGEYWTSYTLNDGHFKWWSWYKISFNSNDWMWSMIILQPYIMMVSLMTSGFIVKKYRK